MKFKKIAVLILAALMILPVFCVSTRAADDEDEIIKYKSTKMDRINGVIISIILVVFLIYTAFYM